MSKANYRKLRKEWYAKLKESGFNDIEASETRLKSTSYDNLVYPSEKQLPSSIVLQAKIEYREMADDFLNTYAFKSNLERVIWEYHANSISYRNIAKLLYTAKITKTKNYDFIFQIVKRLKAIMLGKNESV